MTTSGRKQMYILLGIGGVVCVLAIGLFVYNLQSVTQPDTTENNQPVPASVNESNSEAIEDIETNQVSQVATSTIVEPTTLDARTNSDMSWQDDVVEYNSAESNTTAANDNSVSAQPAQPTSPYSIDDIPNLDLHINGNTQPIAPGPGASSSIDISTSVSTEADDIHTQLPSMENQRFGSCGTVTVPTGFALAMFALSAQNDPTVICLGETIAKPVCGNKQAAIESEGASLGTVFIAKRPDDSVCSVGAALDEGKISMCSVARLMNVGLNEDKSMSQWRTYFESDPGKAFADLYINNSNAFSDPQASAVYDCKVYTL